LAPNDIALRLDHLLDADGCAVEHRAVAAALGVKPTRLPAWERCAEAPSLRQALRFAALLGCAVEDLYPDAADAARGDADKVRRGNGWTVAPARSARRVPSPGASDTERWRAAGDLAASAPAVFGVFGLLVYLGIRHRGPPPVDAVRALRQLGGNDPSVRAVIDRLKDECVLVDLGVQWRWREPLRLDLLRVARALGVQPGAVRVALDRLSHDGLLHMNEDGADVGERHVEVAWEHLAPCRGV
jgi:DNA-binding XRE family transcriptional regulator